MLMHLMAAIAISLAIRWLAGRCGGITGLLGEFIKISWSGLDFEQEQQHANA
jgi:hypothetical protein